MSIGPYELLIACGILFVLIIIPAAIVYAIVLRSRNTGQKRIPCPYCAELILPDAKVCRYCGRSLDNQQQTM
jgi:hypothetical protein